MGDVTTINNHQQLLTTIMHHKPFPLQDFFRSPARLGTKGATRGSEGWVKIQVCLFFCLGDNKYSVGGHSVILSHTLKIMGNMGYVSDFGWGTSCYTLSIMGYDRDMLPMKSINIGYIVIFYGDRTG